MEKYVEEVSRNFQAALIVTTKEGNVYRLGKPSGPFDQRFVKKDGGNYGVPARAALVRCKVGERMLLKTVRGAGASTNVVKIIEVVEGEGED